MGQVLFALVILLACTHSQCGFPPSLKGNLFSPPVTNTASVGSIVPVAPLNPAPAPAPTPALVNPFLSGGLAPSPAPALSSSPLSGVPSVTDPAPAPAPSGNAPPGGFLNPTKSTKSPYGQISMNHVMNMDFGINMDVSFIKRVENKDDKYCQTHCLNDMQNCAVAVHCDWTPPTATTAAPCVGNIFQCGTFSINRGGTTDKGVCLIFEQKTGLEDTNPGITSESNCREVVYHPTCRDWTAGVPDHWVPTGRPTFQAGAAVSRSFLCEEGYQKAGVLKVTCDHTGKKTPQSGASCTLPGESTNTGGGGGLPTIDIPNLIIANRFPAPAPIVTTRKPDITSRTTSGTTTTSPTTRSTTSSTTTTSPTTSSTTSSTTTTSPTTSSTTSSTTTTSPTTSSTTSSTTTASPTTSSTTSSTTTTSPTTSSTTSSTTTTSPTTSSTTSSTTTTSPTTSSTTSSTTTTSPTTSSTTSRTTTTSPTTSSTTSRTTTTSPTTSSTTSSTTTTSPTTSSTTSRTTTTSPTTSSTTSRTTTTSPTTSSTTSSTTTTSPTTSSTTSSTTTTSPTTSSTTSSTTTTSPTTSSTTSSTTTTTPESTTTTTTAPEKFYFMNCQDFTINSVTKEEDWKKKRFYDDHYCNYYAAHLYNMDDPYLYCYTSNWNSKGRHKYDYMYTYIYDDDSKGKQCKDLCPMFIDWMNDYGKGKLFTMESTMTCYYYGAYLYWPNNYYYWLEYKNLNP